MELAPQSTSLSSQALALSGNRYVLTGEPSTNKVNWSTCRLLCDIAYIIHLRHIRPVPVQDIKCVFILLDLKDTVHAHPVEAEVEAADPRE